MNRIEYINEINTYSSRFVLEVEGFTAMGLYHINIHAETFIIPVLDLIFGIKLKNLNTTESKNYPAIDLADFDNRIAFQVTSTSKQGKIQETINKFVKHELYNDFDSLYFYILTEKKKNYNEAKLLETLDNKIEFNTKDYILDKDSILERINSIQDTMQIAQIAKHYKHDFSEVQIEQRREKYKHGYLNTDPENILANLIKIEFPNFLYQAELNIDEELITNELNEHLVSIGKKPVKKLKPNKLVRKALKRANSKVQDWILYKNLIISFRDPYDESDGFNHIIDKGTVEKIDTKDFYEGSEAQKRVFKSLLNATLTELCRKKDIEYFHPRGIFRFANNQIAPNKKRVKWKGKKEATKTVIFEIINKKEGHIICFRSLAFKANFIETNDHWYILLNPTWSFTNPGGYKPSRYESSYMSGLKRLENNQTILNYLRFFAFYLSTSDLFNPQYNYLKISAPTKLSISPRLEEKKWKPKKSVQVEIDNSIIDIDEDTETNDLRLFD